MTARSLFAAVTLALVAAPASAQISTDRKVRAPFDSVVARANQSTVRVMWKNEKETPPKDEDLALGTIVFADGYILTKSSELRAGELSVRLADGAVYEAEIVGRHRETDLAMLRIDATGLKPVTFADTKRIALGSWLAAAGPTTDAVGVGILSAAVRKIPPPSLFDDEGLIVNHNRGFMGVLLDENDPKDKDGKVLGAKITRVDRNTPAAKAGFKVQDLITAVGSTKVEGRVSLQQALEDYRPGDSIQVTLLRDGEEKQIKLTLGAAPVDPTDRSRIQNHLGGALSGRRTGFPAVMQTDMVVEPKHCGGPVVDLEGNVLGISIARAGRVETWILPSEYIRPLLEDLKAGKFAPASVSKRAK